MAAIHTPVSNETRQKAAALAVATLQALGREDLLPALWIEWKNSFTARLGDACYVAAGRPCRRSTERYRVGGLVARVRFSVPLWARASQDERDETVVHEIAHIVAAHEAALAGTTVSSSHGIEWKRVMLRAGRTPRRCHNIDRTGLARSKKTIPVRCSCGESHVTPLVAGRILNGSAYGCRRCGTRLVVLEEKISYSLARECEAKASKDARSKARRRNVRRLFR